MKKFLVFSAMFGAMLFAVPSIEAKTSATSASADTQINVRIGQPRRVRYRRGARKVVTRRITRVGRFRYRETIRRTYLPNGRVITRVIRRTRLGRW